MRCPACEKQTLKVRDRLRVAARAQVRCPACGVAIRLGFWPRLVHLLLGDAVLVGGFVGALALQSPLVLGLASTSWVVVALIVPIQPATPGRRSSGSG